MEMQSTNYLVKLFIIAKYYPNGLLKWHEQPHCIAFMAERPVK
jgi:hypothetical protein